MVMGYSFGPDLSLLFKYTNARHLLSSSTSSAQSYKPALAMHNHIEWRNDKQAPIIPQGLRVDLLNNNGLVSVAIHSGFRWWPMVNIDNSFLVNMVGFDSNDNLVGITRFMGDRYVKSIEEGPNDLLYLHTKSGTMVYSREDLMDSGDLYPIAYKGSPSFPSATCAVKPGLLKKSKKLNVQNTLKKYLRVSHSTLSNDIRIKMPDAGTNGDKVEISVSSRISGTSSITIMIANQPSPFSAKFNLGPPAVGFVATSVRLCESSRVYVFVKAGDKVYSTSKNVKVPNGSCSLPTVSNDLNKRTIELYATAKGGVTTVEGNITHPMGDEAIQIIGASHNGTTMLRAVFDPTTSADPIIKFKLKGGTRGDSIGIQWFDSKTGKDNKQTNIQ